MRLRLLSVLTTLTLAACSSASPVASPPTVTPSPPSPVRGQTDLVVVSSSAGPIVFHNQPAPPSDDAAVAAFAAAVVSWLDRHLTDLQGGGSGLLVEVAAPRLLDGAPAESVAAVTLALVSPKRPAANARYHVVVAQEGPPLWARADVTVRAVDGTTAQAGFVFIPGPTPVLVAAQGPP